MKKIAILIIVLASALTSFSQSDTANIKSVLSGASTTNMTAKGYGFKFVRVDSGMWVKKPLLLSDSVFMTKAISVSDSSNRAATTKFVKQAIAAGGGGGGGNKVDSVTISSDSLFYWINGTDYYVGNLADAAAGGDTTIFEIVLDSTGQQNNRILFSKNNKISSNPKLLIDSANNKVVINNSNVSAGDADTRLYVNGKAEVGALKLINPVDALGNKGLRYNTTTGIVSAAELLSLTTTGSSGAATYNATTGVLNIPQYATSSGTVTSVSATYPMKITGSPTTTPTVAADTGRGNTQIATAGLVDKVRDSMNLLKQNLVSLTTTGSSGAATFNQSTGALNIPQYAGGVSSGTYATMIASSPSAGSSFVCTDYLEGLWTYDGVKWNWNAGLQPRAMYSPHSANQNFGTVVFNGGTGSTITINSELDSIRFHYSLMKTGTTTSGYVLISANANVPTNSSAYLGTTAQTYYCSVSARLQALSDATNRYFFMVGGSGNAVAGDTSGVGVLFYTDNVNSGQFVWKPYTGVRIETTYAPDLNWHKIVIKYKAKNAYLYIDGTLISSYAQPTAGASPQRIPTSLLIVKTAGTTDRIIDFTDYYNGHTWNNF